MKNLRLLLLAVVCGTSPLPAATGGIQMFPASGELQPSSTVELRFPVPMVAPDALGPAAEPPVVITPALPGQFTWLSTRSGLFSPQGPLPLGTAWEVQARPGLTDADGRTVDTGFRAVLRTPPFGITAVQNGVWNADEVASDVTVRVAFNLPVAADAKFFAFTDQSGRSVPAKVRPATSDDYFNLEPEQDDWTWRARAASDPATAANQPRSEFPARLLIEPAAALPSGSGLSLRVGAGLPSADGAHQLSESVDIPLGSVPPFTLKTIEAGNYINSGPTLYLEFSGGLAPDITEETASKFITIDPVPPDLRWEVSYGAAIARGKFERDRDYTVTIGEDVCSVAGQAFDGSRTRTVRFAPVPPRLYLPELTMSQILGGRRLLPVRSVNIASLRVRAVLLSPEQAARALSVFTVHEWKYREGQPVPEVDFTGRQIADEKITLTDTAIDRRQTTDLDWTRLLGGAKAGVIYLKVEGQPLPGTGTSKPAAQAVIQLTDLGILWKKTGRAIRTFVFSNSTAQPAAETSLALLDESFKTLVSTSADAQGNATLDYAATPAWLVARRGDDTCILRMGAQAQSLPTGEWFFANWDVTADAPGDLRASFFTDRPLYQPGETARIKGYLRRFAAEGAAFANGREVNLILRNPNFDEIQRVTATTDPEGAFNADLVLPSGPLGPYILQLETAGLEGGSSIPILLAAYQPDAFEVDLALPAEIPAGAPAPQATVSGQYFFGGRITDAEVRWTLHYTRTPFMPTGFERFTFLDTRDEEEPKPLTLRGDGLITGGASLTIEPVLPTAELTPHRGVLTAEVTDLNQQTVSRTAEFTREASDFYLGLARPGERVVRRGDKVPIQVIAVQPDGQPVTDPVDVSVSIWRWRYNVVRELGAGGAMTFRRDTIEEPMLEDRTRTVSPEFREGLWNAPDTAPLLYQAEALGHHRVRVSARDRAGREVVTESSFYVAGDGETVWDYDSPYRVKLVADKESYAPGETARVLVQTPIAGEAIVSIERGESVLRTLRLSLEGNAPVVEVPLDTADAPGVTVSLVLLRGSTDSKRKFPTAEFRYGSCALRVDDPSARLNVEITPQSPRVQPGDEVSATVTVRDYTGRPVPRAGVTFYAVDDGVLALTGFKRPDPAEVFLAPVATRVLTGLSLADLVPEDPDDVQFANKGYLIGGGGEGGPVALRENFPGTACWLPSLVTGEDGTVVARFTAPDALTRYRLIAVAASGPAAFGSAESSITISRPLMILPSMGSFANAGDRLVARAVVRNETGQDGTVEVSLKTPGSVETLTLQVPHGGSGAADFTLGFKNPAEVELEWSATMQAGDRTYGDRVRTTLEVGSPMLRLRETYFKALGPGRTNLLEGVNPQITEGRGTAAVTVSNTRLAALGDKARFLVAYPYGCAEQKASSLVPWLLMPVLGPLMPGFDQGPEETERVIKKTIADLFEHQQPDGGLSFWPQGRESSLFPSAWSATVLALAAERGFTLPAQWSRLLDYLAKSLRGLSPELPAPLLAERAFAAYALALAGKPEASYHEELFRRRADLPREARAVLALAIMQSGGPRAMVSTLLSDDSAAPEDVSPYGGLSRDLAIRLLAWTNYQPSDTEVGRLVAELLAFGPQQRDATTQSNAWALLALANYRVQVEKPSATAVARGNVTAGTDRADYDITPQQPVFRRDFAITAGTPLEAENPQDARLYTTTEFDVFPPLGEQPAQDRGFGVSRSYRKIGTDGSLQPAEDLRVGDRVVVTLRLETTRPAWFVVLDDPLPAILEAVNPEFVSRASGEETAGASAPVSHRETRSDRVLYFCDALPPGTYTFQYLARVRTAGESTAAATKAEAMYRPDRFGLGTITRLSSLP